MPAFTTTSAIINQAASLLILPSPDIELHNSPLSVTNVFGDSLESRNQVYISVKSISSALLDPHYDARLHLFRWSRRKKKSNTQPRQLYGWHNPDDFKFAQSGDIVNGSAQHTANNQTVQRRSMWSLSELINQQRLSVTEAILDYHRLTKLIYRSGIGAIDSVRVPTVSYVGDGRGYTLFTRSQVKGHRPAYRGRELQGRYKFCVSIKDPNEPFRGARLYGTFSPVLVVKPNPYPVYPTDVTGVYAGHDTHQVSIHFDGTVNGF